MEDQSVQIVRRALPKEWVVREYRPDYGIDLTVELFEQTDETGSTWEAMGETVFVQVKSARHVRGGALKVYGRGNVEKGALAEDRSESMEIHTVRLTMETSELLTIQAMGAAVPVLLFLVDLDTESIYFVCLNDLIEKVILPRDPDYGEQATKTIHLPVRNRIRASNPRSTLPVATFAKRPKLYAAFARFGYQQHELEYAASAVAEWPAAVRSRSALNRLLDLVRHFLAIDLRYDFWTRIPEWKPIGWSYRELTELRTLLAADSIDDTRVLRDYLGSSVVPGEALARDYLESLDLDELQLALATRIQFIWRRLSNLSRMYEELVREWFLPTYLSHLLTDELDPE